MALTAAIRPQRAALSNGRLVRHELAFFAGITADWMAFLGVLVYAFGRGGATATGLASIALLVPYVVAGPFSGALATRYPPQRVRVAGFATQFVGFGIAAFAAMADVSLVAVTVAAAIGIGATTTMRPTGARVLPGIVRSSRELTVGNLWNGYSENAGALVGPALGSVLLAVGSPALVIAGCSALGACSVAISLLPTPIDPPASSDRSDAHGAFAIAASAVRELRSRPGAMTVLLLAGGQFFVVGAMDIIVVVAAEEELGLGDGGPGWLLTMVGLGGLASGVVAARLVDRPRQAVPIVVAMSVVGAASLVLGLALTAVMAFILLPVIGLARSLIDVLTDVLLHRSAPPDMLGAVYSLLEVSAGLGLIGGSLLAQVAIAASGPRLALIGVGVFFAVQAMATVRRLRLADDSADVPVVSMSMLQGVPLFAPLHQAALEDVARSAVELTVEPGQILIREGDVGDRFYVVAEGTFMVSIGDRPVNAIGRGGSFGEIALLADVPRTATITADTAGTVLAIERGPFLVAVTGYDGSEQGTRNIMHQQGYDLPDGLEADAVGADAGRADVIDDLDGGGHGPRPTG